MNNLTKIGQAIESGAINKTKMASKLSISLSALNTYSFQNSSTRTPNPHTLLKIADFLGVSMEELL